MPDPRFVGTLTSFGAPADNKHVKKNSVTLQGNSGSGWVTIPSDQYWIDKRNGLAYQNDNDGTDLVDWEDYFVYQDAGNVAFQIAYHYLVGKVETTVAYEPITFAEEDAPEEIISPSGQFNGAGMQDALVEGTDIANASITAENIANATITATEIANATITATQIANATILGTNIANATITGANIASGTITGGNIQNASITGSQIANATITATNIANGTILGSNIASQTIAAGNIQALTITANEIADLTIVAGKISNATITGAKIAGATITDANIAASTITGAKIAAGTITAANIAAGTITSGEIAAGTITAANIAANAITSQQLYLGAGGGIPYNINEALLLAHFDGARPYESDFTGSVHGHRGQVATTAGGVIFRPGKFGKAVQIAEATTNKVQNPSAETTGNFAARGTATVTRDTTTFFIGATSYKIVLAAANDGVDLTLSALANAVHYVSFWATGSALATLQVSLDNVNWNAITQSFTEVAGANTWTYCVVSILAAQANGSTTLRIRNTANAGTFYIDAAQVEAKSYPTPYCDGSLGTGHGWSGTAHASDSARTAATLTYPVSGNINFAQGSVTFWARINPAVSNFSRALGFAIDANNYFVINLSGAGNLVPHAGTNSAGTPVSTIAGATTASAGWHHIAVTWTSGALKLYLDGVQSGATANYVTPIGAPSVIGLGTYNGAQQANSMIDDFAILPAVLTATEIRAIYDSNAPLLTGANVGEWRVMNGVAQVWGNANGIFAQNASGAPSFGLFNASVNTNTFGGASETFVAGSLLLGDNNTSKANLVYDANTGRLNFRSGTTVASYINAATGVYTLVANETATDTPAMAVLGTAGKNVGSINAYYDTAGAGLAWMSFDGKGTTVGDLGYSQIRGMRQNGTDYAFVQATSEGEVNVDLRNGHNVADNTQRFRIKAKHSSSNVASETVTIEAERSSGATAAGFGSKFNFYAANAAGNQTYQGGIEAAFVGGTTNSNLTIAAQNLVKIYNGAGAPSVTGSRAGNAAVASLLTTLATIGLIADNTTA